MKMMKTPKQRNMELLWRKKFLHHIDHLNTFLKKMEELQKLGQKKLEYELSVNKTVTIAFQEGKEIVVMHCGHSMFMNCVPMIKNDMGPNVLAKIHSLVQNTLFKPAKFYLQPSHADKVDGICFYDCRFCLPGVHGDWVCTKHWDAIRNKVIFQTGILQQQVVVCWHVMLRGKVSSFLV